MPGEHRICCTLRFSAWYIPKGSLKRTIFCLRRRWRWERETPKLVHLPYTVSLVLKGTRTVAPSLLGRVRLTVMDSLVWPHILPLGLPSLIPMQAWDIMASQLG